MYWTLYAVTLLIWVFITLVELRSRNWWRVIGDMGMVFIIAGLMLI